jgi:hypothetical protein
VADVSVCWNGAKEQQTLELGFTKMMQYLAAIELESKRLFEKVLLMKKLVYVQKYQIY